MTQCPDIENFVDERILRLLDQYRESPNLQAIIKTYLRQVGVVVRTTCGILDYFDIDSAVGEQLTFLGKILGWPRCHCKGQRRAVFGFACEDECGPPVVPVAGFCEADWDCGGPQYIEFCFTDDELYRRFLKALVIKLAGFYNREGITAAARIAFSADAVIYEEKPGVIGIASGRLLTGIEISIVHLYQQVLPVAPGIALEIWHGKGPPFGFGAGWGGFCEGVFPAKVTL